MNVVRDDRTGLPRLAATAMLANPAGVLGVIAPVIVTGLTLEAGVPLVDAGRLLSVEFAAMTAGIMLLPFVMERIGNRALAGAAVALALVGQLSSFWGDTLAMAVGRAVLGLSEGMLYGLAIGTLARMPHPARAFGVAVFLNLVTSAVILSLGTWAHLRFPSSGILTLLVAFVALTAMFAPALPVSSGNRRKTERLGRSDLIAFLPGLGGISLLAAGFGAVWPLVASIARSRGLEDAEIGHVLSVAGAAGIAGAVSAIVLAERVGRMPPLVAGSACLAFALAGSIGGQMWLAAPAVLLFWSFLTPYYLGYAAAADPVGRLAAFAGAMFPLGIAAGQALAGTLLSTGRPSTLGFCAGATLIVATGCMLVVSRRTPVLGTVGKDLDGAR